MRRGIIGKSGIVTNGIHLLYDAGFDSNASLWSEQIINNDVTLYNTVPYSTNEGGYYTFDGLYDIGQSNLLSDSINDFSAMVWCYPTSFSSSSSPNFKFIANWRDEDNLTKPSWQLFTQENKFVVLATGANGGGVTPDFNTQGSISLSINNWYCLSVVIDDTNKTIKTYVNNSLNFSGDMLNTIGSATTKITIGSIGWKTSIGQLINYTFSGRISVFAKYNKALTEDQVKQNYNALKHRYGL